MIVAAKGWFGFGLFLLGFIATITARNFAMGINRYLDRDIDRLNPRTQNRPSVDGRVGNVAMVWFVIVNGLIFVGVSYLVNMLAFALSIPILLVLGGYSLFKRFSASAHLILGLSLGLAPIAGAVAVLGAIPLWSVWLSIGVMFWVAGFDLLYSLQDMEFDKAHGLHSIPSKLGAKKSMFLAIIFHLLSVIFWSIFVYSAMLGFWAVLAVVVSALMLGYEHYIVHKDFTKIDRAFFTVNGYLGFIFLGLIVVDIWL